MQFRSFIYLKCQILSLTCMYDSQKCILNLNKNFVSLLFKCHFFIIHYYFIPLPITRIWLYSFIYIFIYNVLCSTDLFYSFLTFVSRLMAFQKPTGMSLLNPSLYTNTWFSIRTFTVGMLAIISAFLYYINKNIIKKQNTGV